MSRPSNREIEQYYFSQFREHFPLPAGTVNHKDKPDVRIHGDRLLGIEIANLYLTHGADPNSEQVQSKRRDAATRDAQRQHLSAGGRNIELTVSFDPVHPITDVKAVAGALATVARAIQHFPAGPIPRPDFNNIPQVHFIYHNPTEYLDARWRVAQVFTVPNLSADRVTELVVAKEKLLPNYEYCDTYWLLLVVDFIDPAQDQEISWPLDRPSLKTLFERVIVYKPQFARWTEVPVTK